MAIIQAAQSATAQRKTRQAPGNSRPRRWHITGLWLSRRRQPSIRARVLSAFRHIGQGVDAKTAYGRTKDFYRVTGHSWTQGLA